MSTREQALHAMIGLFMSEPDDALARLDAALDAIGEVSSHRLTTKQRDAFWRALSGEP